MQKIKTFFANPKNRTIVYNVIRALIPLLVASGFLVPGFDEMIMALVAAALGLGVNELAKRNVQEPTEETELEGLGE